MVEAANPTAATTVMDVVAPPVEKKSESLAAETDPLDQLVADDQKERQSAPAQTTVKDKHDKPAKSQQAAAVKHVEPAHNGVGMAITATVIIVLALAALATYAYVQTNK